MTVAVGVLLFVCALLTLYQAGCSSGGTAVLLLALAGLNVVAGVMGIVSDHHAIQISIGVLLAVWTVVAVGLLIVAANVAVGGNGLGVLVVLAALLFFAWVTTFTVLQFAIVV